MPVQIERGRVAQDPLVFEQKYQGYYTSTPERYTKPTYTSPVDTVNFTDPRVRQRIRGGQQTITRQVVRQGETATDIAERAGASVADLLTMNPQIPASYGQGGVVAPVVAGQTLNVPQYVSPGAVKDAEVDLTPEFQKGGGPGKALSLRELSKRFPGLEGSISQMMRQISDESRRARLGIGNVEDDLGLTPEERQQIIPGLRPEVKRPYRVDPSEDRILNKQANEFQALWTRGDIPQSMEERTRLILGYTAEDMQNLGYAWNGLRWLYVAEGQFVGPQTVGGGVGDTGGGGGRRGGGGGFGFFQNPGRSSRFGFGFGQLMSWRIGFG